MGWAKYKIEEMTETAKLLNGTEAAVEGTPRTLHQERLHEEYTKELDELETQRQLQVGTHTVSQFEAKGGGDKLTMELTGRFGSAEDVERSFRECMAAHGEDTSEMIIDVKPMHQNTHVCAGGCGARGVHFKECRCPKCNSVLRFCGRECQKATWKTVQKSCPDHNLTGKIN